ncbi:MAG: H-NS histone family protein [Candidatus Sedimenticola sp. (ex Thyasira tokunagai)]
MFTQFETMSILELIKARDEIESLIVEMKKSERQVLLENFADQAKKAGFSLEEIVGKQRKQSKQSKAKFRNPNDLTQTWTGRGRKPAWFIDCLANGKTEKDLLISMG